MNSNDTTINAEGAEYAEPFADPGRELLAFLAAPWAIPLALLIPLPGNALTTWRLLDVALGALFFSVYAIPIGYFAELFLGFPAWLLFRKYRIRSVWAFVAGGAALGWLVNALTQLLVGNFHIANLFDPRFNPYVMLDSLAGLAAASAFRAIVFTKP